MGKDGNGRNEKPSPRTQQLPPQNPAVGTGKWGKGTENKKGGGKGEEGTGTGWTRSAQRSRRRYGHHPGLAATSIELRLTAGAEACPEPHLSLWGGEPAGAAPMAPAPPNQQPGCRPPPIRAGRGRSRRQARLRRSPPQCAKPYSQRLRARRRRRAAGTAGVRQVGASSASASAWPAPLPPVFVPGRTLGRPRPPSLSPRLPGEWGEGARPAALPDSRPEPGFSRRLPGAGTARRSRPPGRARSMKPGARVQRLGSRSPGTRPGPG